MPLVQSRGAVIHHDHFAEHGVAELAHRIAVSSDAIEAAVLRRHRRGDHFDFELGQVGRVLHQLLPIIHDCLQLSVVEGEGLEHVRHETELFIAFLEVGGHLRR